MTDKCDNCEDLAAFNIKAYIEGKLGWIKLCDDHIQMLKPKLYREPFDVQVHGEYDLAGIKFVQIIEPITGSSEVK